MEKIRWNTATLVLISAFAALPVLNWYKFPMFLDIYYHLNVMRGFNIAGGIVGHAFWELAPVGNTHLYPPLFHLLLLIPYKMGFDIISIARFFSILSFLSLLATLSFVVNRLFSPKTGFFVTAAAVIPYTFFLKLTITVPVSLSLTFILLAFYAFERNRKIACPMLIACAFYTHLGIPWFGVLAFVIYGAIKKDLFKQAVTTVVVALLLSAPVIIHTFANLYRLENPLGIKVAENELFEFYPFIYIFAALGLLRLRESGYRSRGSFFIALFLGFLPMALNYRFRFLSGEGMLPLLFFAGVGIEKIYNMLEKFLIREEVEPRLAAFYLISFLVLINVLCPTISLYPELESGKKELAFFFRDSTLDNLFPAYKKHVRPFEINLVDSEANEWIWVIKNNTAPDDIICSNWAYIGGMLSALTGRPNAAQTFYEVKRLDAPINEFASTKLAIWLREFDGNYDETALGIAYSKYKFRLISETDKAKILIRDGTFKSAPEKPVIKTGAALSMLLCAFLVICYDFARPRKKFNNLSRSSLE